MPPINLSAVSPAAKPLFGLSTGGFIGNRVGQTLGLDEKTSTGVGMGAGLLATSPLARKALGATLSFPIRQAARLPLLGKHVDYAARISEEAGLPNAASPAYNLLMRPRYPIVEPLLNRGGKLTNWVPGAARLAPHVASGVGAAVAGGALLNQFPAQMEHAAREAGVTDPDQIDELRRNTLLRTPQLAWQTFMPGWMGGDTTPVGDAQREMFKRTAIPGARNAIYDLRQKYPNLAKGIDISKSLTPFGYAQTVGVNQAAVNKPVDDEAVFRDILREKKEEYANRLGEVPESGLLRAYGKLLGPVLPSGSLVHSYEANGLRYYYPPGPKVETARAAADAKLYALHDDIENRKRNPIYGSLLNNPLQAINKLHRDALGLQFHIPDTNPKNKYHYMAPPALFYADKANPAYKKLLANTPTALDKLTGEYQGLSSLGLSQPFVRDQAYNLMNWYAGNK